MWTAVNNCHQKLVIVYRSLKVRVKHGFKSQHHKPFFIESAGTVLCLVLPLSCVKPILHSILGTIKNTRPLTNKFYKL